MSAPHVVLILGAGASIPYGYPSGRELVKVICKCIESPEWQEVYSFLRVKIQDIKVFHEALLRSCKSSVDSFLEHRPELMDVGKLTIALALIPYENEGDLINLETRERSWYEYLFNELDTSLDLFPKHPISVITFNYDRSFEHFFYSALLNSHNTTPEKVAEAMKRIEVIHLYGHLGSLPWQESRVSRPYARTFDHEEIQRAASQLKIVSEGTKDTPEFVRAREALRSANRIYAIGFGYHPDNVARLDLSTFDSITMGSAFNLEAGEIAKVKRLCPRITLAPSQHDAIKFIRAHVRLG